MLREQNPTWTNVQIRDRLNATAENIGLGFGLVDAAAAVGATGVGAIPAGHTLPGTMSHSEIVATSVSMKNSGTTTWSGSSFSLQQWSRQTQIWSPISVSLGTSVVAPGQTKTFNFNLRHLETEFCGYQDNYWAMNGSSGEFGEKNGRRTYVKYCGLASAGPLQSFFAWLGPARAYAAPGSLSGLQDDEVVQELRIPDFRLPVEEIREQGEFRLRYRASLSEDWDVDFRFRIVFDPAVFAPGRIVRGIKASRYEITSRIVGPGEVVIQAKRKADGGIEAGQGSILEIPLVLRPGA